MKKQINKEEWVGSKEVAEALGVSLSKARSVIRQENLTVFTVGNRWRIFKADLDRLVIEAQKRGGV